jgi:hypothetical protein
MIACSGSSAGTAGTVVRPAPSRDRFSRVDPVPSRRVAREPGVTRADPIGALASRPEDFDRVEIVPAAGEVSTAAPAAPPTGPAPTDPDPANPDPADPVPTDPDPTDPVPAGAGEPQTSQ